ncbi:MAG: hypothetical protein Q8M92_05660 [Candidatus Subteraquimicrobiales bacterium]|nr:hypothetical protein [Candidatus Subteraquimicrobiales bacterium]
MPEDFSVAFYGRMGKLLNELLRIDNYRVCRQAGKEHPDNVHISGCLLTSSVGHISCNHVALRATLKSFLSNLNFFSNI